MVLNTSYAGFEKGAQIKEKHFLAPSDDVPTVGLPHLGQHLPAASAPSSAACAFAAGVVVRYFQANPRLRVEQVLGEIEARAVRIWDKDGKHSRLGLRFPA